MKTSATLDTELALLDSYAERWTIKSRNRDKKRNGYEVTIWSHGKRVTATGPIPVMVIRRAMDKHRAAVRGDLPATRGETHGLRLVGGEA